MNTRSRLASLSTAPLCSGSGVFAALPPPPPSSPLALTRLHPQHHPPTGFPDGGLQRQVWSSFKDAALLHKPSRSHFTADGKVEGWKGLHLRGWGVVEEVLGLGRIHGLSTKSPSSSNKIFIHKSSMRKRCCYAIRKYWTNPTLHCTLPL